MPNDIKKLRRLMRTAHVLQKGDEDHKYGQSLALKRAWWFESFRDALANGFARFTYYKKDGTTRTALGTRSSVLIPGASPQRNGESGFRLEGDECIKAIPYFDLDKREWRSFSVLNFVCLDQAWTFNNPGTSSRQTGGVASAEKG